jgi:hypothetical protein
MRIVYLLLSFIYILDFSGENRFHIDNQKYAADWRPIINKKIFFLVTNYSIYHAPPMNVLLILFKENTRK